MELGPREERSIRISVIGTLTGLLHMPIWSHKISRLCTTSRAGSPRVERSILRMNTISLTNHSAGRCAQLVGWLVRTSGEAQNLCLNMMLLRRGLRRQFLPQLRASGLVRYASFFRVDDWGHRG